MPSSTSAAEIWNQDFVFFWRFSPIFQTMQWRIPYNSPYIDDVHPSFTHHFPAVPGQVVDSADPDRIGDSKEELRLMLEEEELKGVTLLVLANKQDPFGRTWQQKQSLIGKNHMTSLQLSMIYIFVCNLKPYRHSDKLSNACKSRQQLTYGCQHTSNHQ